MKLECSHHQPLAPSQGGLEAEDDGGLVGGEGTFSGSQTPHEPTEEARNEPIREEKMNDKRRETELDNEIEKMKQIQNEYAAGKVTAFAELKSMDIQWLA